MHEKCAELERRPARPRRATATPLSLSFSLSLQSRHLYITQSVFKSFCKSQFPHKFFNFFLILVISKDNFTDLWGGLTSAKRL